MTSPRRELVAGSKSVLQGVGITLAYFGIIAVLMYPVIRATGFVS